MNRYKVVKIIAFLIIAFFFVGRFSAHVEVFAGGTIPSFELNVGFGGTDDPAEVVPALQVLFLVSLIALAPSLLLLLTGFTRIVIIMFFLRQAMATQQMPPNQVMIGIALFLTIFIMSSTLGEINENAIIPFSNGEISTEEAIDRGMAPIREFMIRQARERDVELFLALAGETATTEEEIGNHVLIPAFLLGELTTGFIIGFIIYLPFIVIDMVVASVLMAMGMMMLPPAMISMPFKILLFLLAGGWGYVIEFVMLTFR